jgi:hypothetical protein
VFVNYGSSFGVQLAVRQPGTEDFYAHLSRVDVNGGDYIEAGQQLGAVGSTGNSTGPHLHLESHTGWGWRCDYMTDPAVAINYRPTGDDQEDDMTPEQAKKLGEIHWAINQIRGTDLPPIRSQTDTLAGNKIAEIRWGVIDDAQGVRRMVADVQAQLRAIEEALGMTPTAAGSFAAEPPEDAD